MNIWIIILGMALVSYLLKFLPLALLGENAVPSWARRGLNYVPIIILSALIGVSFVPSTEWFSFTLDAHLPAGIVAILIAWFTRNALLTIAGAGWPCCSFSAVERLASFTIAIPSLLP